MSKASTGHAESAWLLRFQIEAENGSDSWEEDARRELGAASPVHPYLTTTHSGSFRPSLIRHTDGPLPLARESFNSTFLQSHTQAQKRALSHLPPFLRAPTRERGALWGAPEVPLRCQGQHPGWTHSANFGNLRVMETPVISPSNPGSFPTLILQYPLPPQTPEPTRV